MRMVSQGQREQREIKEIQVRLEQSARPGQRVRKGIQVKQAQLVHKAQWAHPDRLVLQDRLGQRATKEIKVIPGLPDRKVLPARRDPRAQLVRKGHRGPVDHRPADGMSAAITRHLLGMWELGP